MEKDVHPTINRVPKSHPRMLVMACFFEATRDQRTLQAEDKGHIHIPTRWAWIRLQIPAKDTAMARVLQIKRVAYRDDRIVHFNGDPEDGILGRLAHSKTMDTSFVENLPEGTVVTDGVAVQCRVPRLGASNK
jgi:hypothetical protein